ncbi:MAG: hypothetical protein HYV02_05230 [Deltaproteobacteria bacterium]|nr:hypothetical protein [Deltaproteobacteria bacterium]
MVTGAQINIKRWTAGAQSTWMAKAKTIHRTLPVSLETDFAQLGMAVKGDVDHATDLRVMIPGYAVDNRGFHRSFASFLPQPHQALTALAVVGRDANVPTAYLASPSAIVGLYSNAIEEILDGDVTVTIGGNSYGALIALGVVLNLAERYQIKAHYVGDAPATWNTLGEHPGTPFLGECSTFLHRCLTLTTRWFGARGVKVIAQLFRIPWIVDWLTHHLYNDPTPEEQAHYRALIGNRLTEPGAPHIFDSLAQMAAGILGWRTYLAGFKAVTVNPLTGEITRIQLPADGRLSASPNDDVFGLRTAHALQRVLCDDDNQLLDLAVSQGPHLERTPRMFTTMDQLIHIRSA